jgi:hypothetical protein
MAKQVITAKVEAVNERGVKVNGQWYNFSSYAQNGAIDRSVAQGDTAEIELTGTGWIRKLRIVQRAQTQHNPQGAAQPNNGLGARALDAAQYARLRAVEIAAPIAVQFSEDLEAYMQNLSTLANWIAAYIEGGDPLG